MSEGKVILKEELTIPPCPKGKISISKLYELVITSNMTTHYLSSNPNSMSLSSL